MIIKEFIIGNELEERLSPTQMEQFNSLMRDYFIEVSKVNPLLVNLEPPYGIKDVREYLDRIAKREKAQIQGESIIGLKKRETYNEVVGFLTFLELEDALCETHLVVNDNYRGEGVGTDLLKSFVLTGKRRQFREARIYNFTVGGYGHGEILSLTNL